MNAYDPKMLVEKMKNEGLDIAEDAAGKVFMSVMSWMKESAVASENKIDDMIVGLMPPVEAYVMEQIDKIDGEVG